MSAPHEGPLRRSAHKGSIKPGDDCALPGLDPPPPLPSTVFSPLDALETSVADARPRGTQDLRRKMRHCARHGPHWAGCRAMSPLRRGAARPSSPAHRSLSIGSERRQRVPCREFARGSKMRPWGGGGVGRGGAPPGAWLPCLVMPAGAALRTCDASGDALHCPVVRCALVLSVDGEGQLGSGDSFVCI